MASVPVKALDGAQEARATRRASTGAALAHVSHLAAFDQALHIHTARHVCSHNTTTHNEIYWSCGRRMAG